MKKPTNNLSALLENVMSEDNPPPVPQNTQQTDPPETPLDVSLDAALDRYVVRYEKESIPTSETYEDELYGEPTYESVIREALYEAPEDEEEPLEDEEGMEDDAPMDDGGFGGEEAPPEGDVPAEQPVMNTPQINLQDFARSVARLVNNYDALLNPKNTILNRVEKYVETNYDVRTAKELVDLLDRNYGLRSDADEAPDEWPTPQAAGSLSTEG